MVSTTLRHFFTTGWSVRRAFDVPTLQAIEQAIADSVPVVCSTPIRWSNMAKPMMIGVATDSPS